MKFSDGAWLWAKGVRPSLARRVIDYRIEADALSVWLVDRNGDDGIDRVEGVVLQLRITSPMADVLRVQIIHNSPTRKGPNGFELNYALKANGMAVRDQGDQLIFTSGRISAIIDKKSWGMKFVDAATNELITKAGADSLGHVQVENDGAFLMQRLQLGVGENLYGFGEQFTPFVKNGQTVKVWNEDGGTVSDQAYKCVPFYLSSCGYGLLVNTPAKVEFEVATERVQQVQFSVGEETLDYYVFYGPDPKDVLSKYTALSGRVGQIPAWSFGLWLSTSFTTQYDEKTVNEFVDGMISRGIPLSVFHFDCFWMKQRHWCNFLWDREKFPDPRGMIQRLKAKGLKVCVWINSYVSGLSEIFEEGRSNGYFIQRKDGSVFQRDQWQPSMAIVDFTNPAAVKWYQGKLRALLEMGVDCFKTDFGERIPAEDVTYFDGSDPKLMHNYYPYLYNKAVFELLEQFHGKGNAIVFARSATTGCQKFPIHWGGDCEATFESMAEDLRGGLSFCSSGAAFWSHDIGGFTGKADPAVYKRWVAFGLLSSHSRLHGSESYRVPWLFDEESVDVVRQFAQLKNRLFPYLYSAARQASERGWPVMRAMFLEFPDDPACRHLDRQYMLGSSLLVAPVFRHDGVAEYYVPRGKWTDYFTGQVIEGGQWRSEKFDFLHVPLLVRESSIIPQSENAAQPGWTLGETLTLNLYQVGDGSTQEIVVPSSHGDGVAKFRCRREKNRITIESDGKAKQVRAVVAGKSDATVVVTGGVIQYNIAMANEKSWQARIGEANDALAQSFVESISYDRRLYKHDIAGSIAHATMLAKVGLITDGERDKIVEGLKSIERDIEAGNFKFDESLEDIHMVIEAALIERIGEPGKKLHTGRSRNDQVATDLLLWINTAAVESALKLNRLCTAFVNLAERSAAIVMRPSYTHLQRAQPISAGAEALAWCAMLSRNGRRVMAAVDGYEIDDSPLGSGAIAGTSLSIDSKQTAELLRFSDPPQSSIELTASRDRAVDFLYSLSMISMHLSRWAEQWIIYSTTEFGFIKISDKYTTGSSMMPQKRNPDMLELIRGRCGNVYGDLFALMTILKGLPIGYNRDLQEDKRIVFRAYDTVTSCLAMATAIVNSAEYVKEKIEPTLERGFLDATSLAEYFVTKGIPFRTAHQIVGSLVAQCEKEGKTALAQLSLETFVAAAKPQEIGADVFEALGAKNVVKRYQSAGAAGGKPFEEQLAAWKKRLGV